jgi:hypothetical protein
MMSFSFHFGHELACSAVSWLRISNFNLFFLFWFEMGNLGGEAAKPRCHLPLYHRYQIG